MTEDTNAPEKRTELTLEEKIKLVQERRDLRAQKLKDTDKQLQALKRKLSVKNRKERAHRLIELGAFVESFLHTSTNEEAITLITTHMKTVAQEREQRLKENASSQS